MAVKTLVYHPAELVRDPICHIEPVQLSMKELCQTAVALPSIVMALALKKKLASHPYQTVEKA